MQNEKEVLILRNIRREGPGIIKDILEEEDIRYLITDSFLEIRKRSLEGIGALIVMGGPESANDLTEKMIGEISVINEFLKSGIPVLGICLGLQVLVKAAGGKVVKSPVQEVGFRDETGEYYCVDLTAAGRKDPVFSGLESTLPLFQLHGEMIEPADNMELLATGKYCSFQVMKVGSNSYGFQGHHELTREMLETWLYEDDDLKKLDRYKVIQDFEDIREQYTRNGKTIFRNFLKITRLV